MYSELKKMKISIREFFEMQQKHYSEKTENTTEEDGLNLNFYFINSEKKKSGRGYSKPFNNYFLHFQVPVWRYYISLQLKRKYQPVCGSIFL